MLLTKILANFMEWLYWVVLGFWLGVFVLSLIVELLTTGIFSGIIAVSVIPAIFIAGFAGHFTWTIPVQLGSAVLLWIILYFSFYRILKSWIDKRNKYKGPIEDFIGEEIELLSEAHEAGESPQQYGKVILKSFKFRVLAIPSQGIIPSGTKVKVVKIEGNTLYVKRSGY